MADALRIVPGPSGWPVPDRRFPVKSGLTPKRRRRDVENPEYAKFIKRLVRAHGRRVADGDVEGLADLLDVSAEVDQAVRVAVAGLRAAGYSWGEISDRLGTTRQAAHQRWGP